MDRNQPTDRKWSAGRSQAIKETNSEYNSVVCSGHIL